MDRPSFTFRRPPSSAASRSGSTRPAQLQRSAAGLTAANAGTNAAEVAPGVGLGSVDNVMTTGATRSTGNPLDVAIHGDGFFELATGNPAGALTPTSYTRAGNFTLDGDGYLCTQDGKYVIATTTAGGRGAIEIPSGASALAVDPNGGVSYVDPASNTRVTPFTLELATFSNHAGLERAGKNEWVASVNSGTVTRGGPGTNGLGTTMAGAVEMPNADLAQTFTDRVDEPTPGG